jgi:GrpB-like predicted nucleotidyltransferase (UPF0157 family)
VAEHRRYGQHLHIVEARFEGWRDWLVFRDHLRAHPAVAAEYGALKVGLATAHGADPNDRDAYRAAKTEFIHHSVAAARSSRP